MKKFMAILLAVLLLCSLAACGKKPDPVDPDKPVSDDKYGGDVVITCFKTYNTVGYPISGGAQGMWLAQPAIERLGRYNAEGGVDGWLAKDIKTDPENLELVITLNEGIKYHNGDAFNAQAVCDVWQFYIDDVTGAGNFEAVESFSATGEYEVTVKLKYWSNDIVVKTCVLAGDMLSPTAIKELGSEKLKTTIIGTGPFKCQSYDVTGGITYVKNEDYWRDGEPYLDSIEIIFHEEMNAGVNILKAHEANLGYGVDFEKVKELVSTGEWSEIHNPACISPTFYGIMYCSGDKNQPVSDVRVRRAISHAINKQELFDAFALGYGQLATQLAVTGSREYNKDVPGFEYDVEKAKALLKEAGYEEGECKLTFFYSAREEDLFVAIKDMLEKAGFVVEGDNRQGQESRARVGTSDPYTCMMICYAPTTAPDWWRWYSDNPVSYVVNTIDLAPYREAYKTAMTATDPETEREALDRLQMLGYEDCLYTPLWHQSVLVAVNDGTVFDTGIGEYYHLQWTPGLMWKKK